MTQLLSFDRSGFQFAWDATSVAAFEKCPRYYQLRHLEGWQPSSKSEHLIFGGVYAKALETYHKLIATGETQEDALRSIVRLALIETWEHELDAEGNRIPDTGKAWLSLHQSKTRETLLRSIVWYVEHFIADPATIVTLADGSVAAELSFSLPLGDDDLLYCGHLDKLVNYSGGRYVMDQKTTGATVTPYFFEGYNPDVQMGGYTWAGKILFNMPVSGVIIDVAQIAVGFTRFARGFVNYPEPLLAEWHSTTRNTIREAKRAHESGEYPMRRSSCGNYGGCDFRRVCSRIPQHRENILHANFERKPRWDPLQRR